MPSTLTICIYSTVRVVMKRNETQFTPPSIENKFKSRNNAHLSNARIRSDQIIHHKLRVIRSCVWPGLEGRAEIIQLGVREKTDHGKAVEHNRVPAIIGLKRPNVVLNIKLILHIYILLRPEPDMMGMETANSALGEGFWCLFWTKKRKMVGQTIVILREGS